MALPIIPAAIAVISNPIVNTTVRCAAGLAIGWGTVYLVSKLPKNNKAKKIKINSEEVYDAEFTVL